MALRRGTFARRAWSQRRGSRAGGRGGAPGAEVRSPASDRHRAACSGLIGPPGEREELLNEALAILAPSQAPPRARAGARRHRRDAARGRASAPPRASPCLKASQSRRAAVAGPWSDGPGPTRRGRRPAPATDRTGVDSLTPSEGRVVSSPPPEGTNREIAQTLFVTEKTVETHLGRAFRKLDVTSRRQLPDVLARATSSPA